MVHYLPDQFLKTYTYTSICTQTYTHTHVFASYSQLKAHQETIVPTVDHPLRIIPFTHPHTISQFSLLIVWLGTRIPHVSISI